VTIKELLEIIILIIGGGGAAATAGFAFAIHQEKQKLDQLRIDIKDAQLNFQTKLHHTLTVGQSEFARKVQQNIDSNGVEIGLLKGEIDDIKDMIQGNYQMKARPAFPPENKPKRTGWTIEDA
jgi:iron uptake system EfeUOB component EfeO/EfeM